MKSHNRVLAILIASTAAAAVPSLGCGASGRAVIVADYNEPPPAPREEYAVYRPGYVWVHGNWQRRHDGRWMWRSGYYERERANHVWIDGRWERRGRDWVWVDGGWRPRGQVTIRGNLRF